MFTAFQINGGIIFMVEVSQGRFVMVRAGCHQLGPECQVRIFESISPVISGFRELFPNYSFRGGGGWWTKKSDKIGDVASYCCSRTETEIVFCSDMTHSNRAHFSFGLVCLTPAEWVGRKN
ncbi:hypothetical protein JTE90_020527 [Oedothorax gibbosus]|uniref:Uncharacterized protein n=1 Tax=Oedothorax gibbosus TaxID=931172 RepID=A0AAV6VWE6_9ARAC|nr:hypothetical protein JTE90_020527 [Oedothorax gibbosus]